MKQYIIILATILLLIGTGCSKEQPDKNQEAKPEKPFRFDDYQDVQIVAAQKYGITPIEHRNTNFTKIPKLEKVDSCRYYRIEYLSHSVPYLTHNAKKLLEEIGKDFQDSLALLGVKPMRICVTSMLRTADDVQRLQRVNSNAVTQSTHSYGTTFDIAHNSFEALSNNGKWLSYRELKTILGHVLYRLRMQHKCLVLIEERQKCYHITCCS